MSTKTVINDVPCEKVQDIFSAEEIAASGDATSTPEIPISKAYGSFVIEATITGDGTCKFELLTSCSGDYFSEPENVDDLATGLTKTSGDGSGHVQIPVSFGDAIGRYMKIKVTETGTSNSVTITAAVYGR
ncbi:hypothetical protein Dalk_4544 [Desulfatibacillum aliphaticivorans]|uniref:Uncharacterized protein n=1 Tax=Desulfatibacillum aliphaticivorans TaxID=218208 RepID=B8FCQ9_DESAL|nr:hypothetical protein [Desulfatibacillum aliphaticivorans]ACL06222.1 hypothetical protein Dalk_4544 [Desulfatibacillum aliphaticivorans]